MKTIPSFALSILALTLMALTPFSPSPRQIHRYATPQVQLSGEITSRPSRSSHNQPGLAGLFVTDLNNGTSSLDLVNTLLGAGVSVSNVTYTGNARAAGVFSGGMGIIGFDSGMILGSGAVQTLANDPPCSAGVEGPNDCYE